MFTVRRLSIALALSLLLNGVIATLWWQARRAAILPGVARVEADTGEDGQSILTVQFSSDMRLDEEAVPVELTPPVAGDVASHWETPRLLRLEFPDNNLIPGKTYLLSPREGQTDARGLPLAQRSTPLMSPPLCQTQPVQIERVSATSSRLQFTFNGLVFPEDLARRVTVTYRRSGKQETIRAEAVQAEYTHQPILTLHHPDLLAEATLAMAPGLKAKDGDCGIEEETLETIKLVPHLEISRVWCPEWESGQLSIRIQSTAAIERDGLQEKIEITPPAEFEIQQEWEGLRLLGNFAPRTFYRIVFRQGIRGVMATTLEADTTFTVVTGRHAPALNFLTSGPLLPRSRKTELHVRLDSVQEATFTAWRVYPRNYVDYLRGEWGWWRRGRQERYGTKLHSVTFTPRLKEGVIGEVRTVPLDELLAGETTGLFVIEADGGAYCAQDVRQIILTDIGLGVVQESRGLLVWALSLADGHPLADCTVKAYSSKDKELGTAQTDATGAALIEYGALPEDESLYLVTAQRGDDLSMLTLDRGTYHNQIPFALNGRPYPQHAYEAFVYTERGICRPGERIIASALVRDDAGLQAAAGLPVELRVLDPLGRVLRRIPRVLDADGFATARFEIPFDARTGGYTVQAAMPGNGSVWGETRFTVGCYRPDQIRTTLQLDRPAYQQGVDSVQAVLDGHYYFGPPAADCPVAFRWDYRQLPFAPQAYADYTFGDAGRRSAKPDGETEKEKTNEQGRANFTFRPTPKGLPAAAWGLTLTAELVAPSGVTVSTTESAVLHHYPFYLGVKPLWQPDAPPANGILTFAWVAVAPDGQSVTPPAAVSCELSRHEYAYVLRQDGPNYIRDWTEQWIPVAKGAVPESQTAASGTFTVACPCPGSYQLILQTRDNVRTTYTFWYSAGNGEFARPASPTALELTTDQAAYQPGTTARVSFSSPFAGQALVCLSGQRTIQTVAVPIQAGTNTVDLPIPPTVPYGSLFVSATLVGPPKDGHDATQRYFGLGRLTIVQDDRRLNVVLAAPDEVRPGSPLPVRLTLRSGETPAAGTVQVLAVDEGVLALTAYRTPDPFAYFHGPRSCSLRFADVYDQIFPDLSGQFGDASPIGGDEALGQLFNPAAAREVKEAVVISRLVRVDESGEAEFTLDLPDHTGALRVMAIAANARQVGSADREVRLHHPLTVLLDMPRAVAPGDQFQATATVFNSSLPETDVELTVETEGTLKLADQATFRLHLGREQRQVMRIPVAAVADQAGPGKLHLVAVAGDCRIEARAELSCRPASPPVFRSGYAVVKEGTSYVLPERTAILPGTGECVVQVSANPAVELAPALAWLLTCDYGCLEQTLSRAMPVVAQRDLSRQFFPDITEDGTERQVREAVLRLSALEQPYGGFGTWPGSSRLWVGGSVYACHFLHEAQRAGYPVDPDFLGRAQVFLRRLVENFHRYPTAQGGERAYAVYLLTAMGEPEPGIARGLAEDAKANPYARFLAAAALIRGGHADQGMALLEPILTQDYLADADCSDFDSLPRRAGLALGVLSDCLPDSPECVRLAGLLRELRNAEGHWGSTQANALAVWGMSRWLLAQKGTAGTGTVRQGETAYDVAPGKPCRLVLSRPDEPLSVQSTTGNLYVSWQLRGVPLQAPTEDVARSLRFHREYLTEDGKPTTTFAQGDLVKVRLTFSATDGIDRFVLADVLPGGFEVEDSSLTTRTRAATERRSLSVDVTEKRDDRLVVSGGLSPCNDKEPGIYEYHVRAVTPGRFAIPRLVAENMYASTQRAETGGGTLTIRPVP